MLDFDILNGATLHSEKIIFLIDFAPVNDLVKFCLKDEVKPNTSAAPISFSEGVGAALVYGWIWFSRPSFKVVEWSKVDKEDYLLAMERSPIKDIEIKYLLKNALTDDINSREVYMKCIDHSYYYEGYTTFKTEEL